MEEILISKIMWVFLRLVVLDMSQGGNTPLHLACLRSDSYPQPDLVSLLLDHGAKPSVKNKVTSLSSNFV
jgi:ankyrin repeat protein